MQDGVPAHYSAKAQRWYESNLLHFWRREVWPGNSPDLNPIDELSVIVKQDLDKQKPAAKLEILQAQFRRTWSKIKPYVLHSLVDTGAACQTAFASASVFVRNILSTRDNCCLS